jgi:hypothetical protein
MDSGGLTQASDWVVMTKRERKAPFSRLHQSNA